MTRSASTDAAMRSGRYFGSCEKSASIWQTRSAPAATAREKPSTYERPRPRCPGPVQDAHPPAAARGQAVGNLAGPVRRPVVGNQDAVAELEHLLDERLDCLALVVRRHDHDNLHSSNSTVR